MKSKKFLTKLLALIISLVSLVGVLSGCQLVNTNTEKDSSLKVMTVQIEKEVEPITIYKRDLYSAYVSYGYYYVNNYGYSVADTYEMIISNYQQNAVVEQFARIKLADLYNEITSPTYTEKLSEFEKHFIEVVTANLDGAELKASSDIDTFLSEYQLAEAEYNVKVTINSLIDSFAEEDEHDHEHEDEEKESVSLEERANPYVAEEEEDLDEWEMKDASTKPDEADKKIAEKKLGEDVVISDDVFAGFENIYQLNKYVFDNYEIDMSTPERVKGFNRAINSYRSLGIIGAKEFYSVNGKPENALKYSYFKDQLATEKAQMLVMSYQDSLVKEVESKLTAESLYADYVNLYNSQKDEYTSSYESYETVLNDLTKDTLLVYNPYDGYGHVSNLLLGFTDEQSAQLTAFKSKKGVTKKEVEKFRLELAKSVIIKDQRLSWATSGKMVIDENDQDNYLFEDKYFLSSGSIKGKINGYIGELLNVTDSTEEDENGIEKTNYFATNGYADVITLGEFYDTYLEDAEIGFEAVDSTNVSKYFFDVENPSVKVLNDYDSNKEAYDNAMKDLIYAFSTDPGSLSSYKGYMYSPYTSKTTYVEEFAEAAKALANAGAGAYTMVVTDFGIHVMVCTEKIAKTTEPIGEEVFKSIINGSTDGVSQETIDFVENFKKVKQDTLVETYVSEMANSFVKDYLEEGSTSTTFYKNNYKDLV